VSPQVLDMTFSFLVLEINPGGKRAHGDTRNDKSALRKASGADHNKRRRSLPSTGALDQIFRLG